MILGFWGTDGTPKYTAAKDTSEIGRANKSRKGRQFPGPEKNRPITRDPIIADEELPDNIHPIAFGLLLTTKNSPTKVNAMAPIATVPIPSMGKKICINKKFGAKKQPKIPKVTAKLPINNSLLWLYLTVKKPSSTAKTTDTTLEMVTN
jgi:hypothetical protein